MYEMGPDDERRTLFVSPHVEEILGYPREEWLEQPDIWVEPAPRDARDRAEARMTGTTRPASRGNVSTG